MSEQLEISLNLEEKRIIIYDFETDGFWNNNGSARPIEVAVFYINPDGTTGKYHSLILRRDTKPLPDKITEITGITTEELRKHGKPIEQVFGVLDTIINGKPKLLIGHNSINFDNKFLNFRFHKLGYKEVDLIDNFDTAGHFKAELLGWSKFSNLTYADYQQRALKVRAKGVYFNLKAACEYYEVEVDPSKQHRADYDVELTTKVFIEQTKRMGLSIPALNNIVWD